MNDQHLIRERIILYFILNHLRGAIQDEIQLETHLGCEILWPNQDTYDPFQLPSGLYPEQS